MCKVFYRRKDFKSTSARVIKCEEHQVKSVIQTINNKGFEYLGTKNY